MKFLGKMQLMIILDVTKYQGFTLFLEDTFLEKIQGGKRQPFKGWEFLHYMWPNPQFPPYRGRSVLKLVMGWVKSYLKTHSSM